MKEEKLLDNFYKYLTRYKVRYLIIGGMAVNYYGIIRTTKDIDIFVETDYNNIVNLLQALEKAGFETAEYTTPEKVLEKDITIFQDIIRLDVLTKVSGLKFDTAWKNRKIIKIDGNQINLLSVDDLILSKKKTGRIVDKDDIEKIKAFKKINKNKN